MKKRYLPLAFLIIFAQHAYAQGITEPVSVTDVTVIDQTGEGIAQALLTNNSDAEQNVVYIVQAKDSDGYTAQLAWQDEILRPRESLAVRQPLVEMHGTYTIEIFVWSAIENPVPLSYSYNSFTFSSLDNLPQCKGTGICFEGSVTKIVDGDTIDVDGKRIRLALVDTPERGVAGYSEATRFTSTLCPIGSKVLVDQDGKQMFDRYGRMIAVVYCDGALLNAELLFAGHAVIMKGFCKASEFGDEDWAKLFGC